MTQTYDASPFTSGQSFVERMLKIKELCGDLCNTDKPIEKAEFLGTVESKVTTIDKQMTLTPKLF